MHGLRGDNRFPSLRGLHCAKQSGDCVAGILKPLIVFGLAIARSIAIEHGGTLTLSNRAKGGLLAVLTLPRWRGGDASSP